jgi:hypothetical protein
MRTGRRTGRTEASATHRYRSRRVAARRARPRIDRAPARHQGGARRLAADRLRDVPRDDREQIRASRPLSALQAARLRIVVDRVGHRSTALLQRGRAAPRPICWQAGAQDQPMACFRTSTMSSGTPGRTATPPAGRGGRCLNGRAPEMRSMIGLNTRGARRSASVTTQTATLEACDAWTRRFAAAWPGFPRLRL